MASHRKQRLLSVLTDIDRRIAEKVLLRPGALSPAHKSVDRRLDSAIRIQCWWRRIFSLQEYRQRLLEHFMEEDRRYWEHQDKVVEETLTLLDSIRLQQDNQNRKWIEEANRRLRQRSAYRIQKWFRRSSSGGESKNREASSNKSRSGSNHKDEDDSVRPPWLLSPLAINTSDLNTTTSEKPVLSPRPPSTPPPPHRHRPVSPYHRPHSLDVIPPSGCSSSTIDETPISPSAMPPESLFDIFTPPGAKAAEAFFRRDSQDPEDDDEEGGRAEGKGADEDNEDNDSIFDVEISDDEDESKRRGKRA